MDEPARDRPETARVADPTTPLSCALCTAAFAYWSWGVTGRLTLPGLAPLVLMPPALFFLGRGLLGMIRFPARPSHPFPIAFLVGALAASFLLTFLNLVSPLSIGGNGVVVLAGAALLGLRGTGPGDTRVDGQARRSALLAVFLGLVASTLWTQDLRPYSSGVGDSVRFRPFVDCLSHAELVAQFSAGRSIRSMGDWDMAGQRLPFYHYASYPLPACLAEWAGQSALESVMTFWVPFGFFLAGLAAYVLASGLWGGAAGVAALIGVLLIPDASKYGVRCGWYSFHWLGAISPGLLYGTAGGALVVLLVAKGVRPTNRAWLVAGVGLAFLNVLMKAQVFVIGAPVLILWFLLFKEGWSTRRRVATGLAVLAAGGLAVVVADVLKVGPLFLLLFRPHGIDDYLQFLVSMVPRGTWGGYFEPLNGRRPIERHLVRAVVLVVAGPFGALALTYPLLAIFSKIRKRLRPEDAIPAFTMGFYLYLVFWTPTNTRGAPDELWHRPFVWVYFLLAVWSWGRSASLLLSAIPGRPRLLPAVLAVVGLGLLAIPWWTGKHVQGSGRPDVPGYTDFDLPADFLACAGFLREHSGKQDVVQNDVDDPRLSLVVPEPVLAVFAERRCFLGRPLKFWSDYAAGTPGESESVRRAGFLDDLRKSSSMEQLAGHARQAGIRWYVARPSEPLRWPPEFLGRPAFASGGYRVYDLRPDGP